MRAVGFTEFGGPEVLRVLEIPEPIAAPGELVVAVVASPINPTDTLMRAGRQAAMMGGVPPPYITGVEFSGRVHRVSDPNSAYAVGQPVMGLVDARRPGGGSHAEFVRVSAVSVVRLPSSVNIGDAATVPMNGLTAMLALEAVGLDRGDTLLITGGAGVVGGYVLQLARHAGLHVVADARETDIELVRGLGAGIVLTRGDGMEADLRRHFANGVDGLIDCALLGERAAALVRAGGTGVSLRKSHAIRDPRLQHRVVSVFETPNPAPALSRLAAFLRDNALTPRRARRLPLEDAAEAHRLVEKGGLRESIALSPNLG